MIFSLFVLCLTSPPQWVLLYFLLQSMCLGVRRWRWQFVTCFPFVMHLVPLKTRIPYVTQISHPANLLTTVIYQTQVIHWQHWYLLLTSFWVTPTSCKWPSMTLMSLYLDLITPNNLFLLPFSASWSHHSNILVLVFTWKYPSSFVLYIGILLWLHPPALFT